MNMDYKEKSVIKYLPLNVQEYSTASIASTSQSNTAVDPSMIFRSFGRTVNCDSDKSAPTVATSIQSKIKLRRIRIEDIC